MGCTPPPITRIVRPEQAKALRQGKTWTDLDIEALDQENREYEIRIEKCLSETRAIFNRRDKANA